MVFHEDKVGLRNEIVPAMEDDGSYTIHVHEYIEA